MFCLWKGAFVNPHCLFFLARIKQYNVEHRGYALRNCIIMFLYRLQRIRACVVGTCV